MSSFECPWTGRVVWVARKLNRMKKNNQIALVGPPEPSVSLFRVLFAMLTIVWRFLTWPVRWIAGHTTSLAVRLYIYYRVQANHKAKCPACGIRAEHDLRWSESMSQVVHVCKRCLAVWTERPVIDAAQWRTTLIADTGEDVINADGSHTTTVQHAQREPQIVNETKLTGTDRPIVVRFPGART